VRLCARFNVAKMTISEEQVSPLQVAKSAGSVVRPHGSRLSEIWLLQQPWSGCPLQGQEADMSENVEEQSAFKCSASRGVGWIGLFLKSVLSCFRE
jgi:hypothetical protein